MQDKHPFETRVLRTDSPETFQAAVREAVALLKHGEAVALPTETVYGLAANAFEPEAVRKIFEVKGRPTHNPIIVHVSSKEMARQCVEHWPAEAESLSDSFWPGPLTMVLRRSRAIPDLVTAGGETVGVRWPGHPFMRAVIAACDFPLAAPSANISNQVSPTTAAHVLKDLAGRIPLIVDGGQAQVGLESTVVDLTAHPPKVLRPGIIHEEALGSVVGPLHRGFSAADEVLKSPGLLKKHYAPRARLQVWDWKTERELLDRCEAENLKRIHVIAYANIPSGAGLISRVSVVPHDAEAFGRALYAELHRCDELGAESIIVERPPEGPEWRAIQDRLSRAES
jgi:L-threonylcarbamoyladenylate synthase